MFSEIFPNIFAFIPSNGGSNCFLLKGKKEIALIDSSTRGNVGALISGLERIGVKPAEVTLIIHTHGHADHFGCDALFPNAKIAMHESDGKKINAGNADFACLHFFPETELPKVSFFLKGGQELDIGGMKLEVIHCPGHTGGSICLLLEPGKVLFSGDCLFVDGFGRTDLASGNAQKLVESLKKLQKLGFKALFPGHGAVLLGKDRNNKSLEKAVKMAANTF